VTTDQGDRTESPPTGARHGRHAVRDDLLAAAGSGIVAALVFLLVRGSLIDDAYITLSYARNLAEHLHWGLTPYRTANSATSPLNVLLLGAATFVVRDAVWGLGLVFVLVTAGQAAGLSRLARDLRLHPVTVVLGVLLVLLSPLMLSIVGMEMALACVLLVWVTVAAVEGRPVAFGLLTAALVLTRLDLAVFPLVLLLATPPLRRRVVRVLLVAVVTVLPWYVFSVVVLGALLPDTLVIKTVSGGWGPWHFINGPSLYLKIYPAATVLTAVPALLGALALLAWAAARAWRSPRWSRLGPVIALGVGGVLHYAAYSVLAPPPFHWYYAPSVTSLTYVLAAVVGAAVPRRSEVRAARATGRRPVVTALVGVSVASLVVLADVAFVAQRPFPWRLVPVTTNWATAQQYRTVGEGIRATTAGQVVQSPGEIGALAYWCRCDIVDPFSDPGTLQPFIDQRVGEAGPVMRLLLRIDLATHDRVPAARPDWRLEWVPRQGAGTPSWPVSSTWRGPGAFQLFPAS